MLPADAITPAEADAAFASLVEYPLVVLAVSGGPDSMALLHLAAEWHARRSEPFPRLYAATVDHGLRPQSSDEAAMVALEAAALGIPHTTLSWLGEKPSTGVSAASREARYRLLAEHAVTLAKGDRAAVVTAHHADDQAETLLMRLARGSGVEGLAAMRPWRRLSRDDRIVLLRPMLAFSKARFESTIRARGVKVTDDPTNRDERFERPRLRAIIPLLRDAGLGPDALALSARRLGDARAALDYAAAAFEATIALDLNHGVFADLDRPAFDLGPAFLRQRIIARLIDCFGGASPRPRLSEIEGVVRRLELEGRMFATLGGAVIAATGHRVRVWREIGRLAAGDVPLSAGADIVWDERFRISRCSRQGGGEGLVTIRPLGVAGLNAIATAVDSARVPDEAAVTQPALWQGGKLVAVPTLLPFARCSSALGVEPGAASARPVYEAP